MHAKEKFFSEVNPGKWTRRRGVVETATTVGGLLHLVSTRQLRG